METYLLHNIGDVNHSNYNKLDDILELDPAKTLLTFDGVYASVYKNREALKGRKVILFVTGAFVGGDNSFDLHNVPKLETFCSWQQIMEMHHNYGFEIGYHSYSHKSLITLPLDQLKKEVEPLYSKMPYFAYPAGHFDPIVIRAVKEAGYKDAWTVGQGANKPFQRNRKYLKW